MKLNEIKAKHEPSAGIVKLSELKKTNLRHGTNRHYSEGWNDALEYIEAHYSVIMLEDGCTVCLNGQIMNKEVLIAGNDCTLMR
tara:strand:+ start:141 stop:392 length:252 start_codon:yes stop_codon:yes gene_type:complete